MIYLVKVEGTIAELKELFLEGVVGEAKKQAKKAGKNVVVAAAKKARTTTKSAWQKYMGQKKNQIKFKSGSKKGRLDLTKMSRAYRRQQRSRK